MKSIISSKSYHLRGPERSVFSGHETGRGAVHQNWTMVKGKPSFLPNYPVQFSPVVSILKKIKLSKNFRVKISLGSNIKMKFKIFIFLWTNVDIWGQRSIGRNFYVWGQNSIFEVKILYLRSSFYRRGEFFYIWGQIALFDLIYSR